MLLGILRLSIRHRVLVLLATGVLVCGGLYAMWGLHIDAQPDLTNVQVQVLTTSPALGPLDVERLVTTPVEYALSGMPFVTEIRSLSRYGVSAVTVVFADHVDPYFARTLVTERMPRARDAVPSTYGVPELGPMSTGLGEIYQFEVRGSGRTPMELRETLDWQIAPRLRMVPGIVEVNPFGGELRTYEVSYDPTRLVAAGVSVQDLFRALERNNRAAGGGPTLRGPEALLVRGDALVSTLEDLRNTIVAYQNGVPVYVRQLGDVRFAPMLRQGAATRDGRGEIMGGMTMMLLGQNSRVVAQAVAETVRLINPTLPPGMRIEAFYDRTQLVNRTIHTVKTNLAEGAVLVATILFLMLLNLRAGLIVTAMIPLAMLVAFIGMRALGITGDLMSLGAIDFGVVVDGAVILLENAVHHCSTDRARLGRPLTRGERDAAVLHSASEVSAATAFGGVIITLVYLPILTLQGVEGRMFQPMAVTMLCALLGALVLSFTFVPALASLMLSANTVDRTSPVVKYAAKLYAPVLRSTIRRPWPTTIGAVAVLGFSVWLATGLGSEFIPRLDENALVIEVLRLPSCSLEESVRQSAIIERVLQRFPEVGTVVVKTGRPEIANDPMGVEASDVFVMLKPHDQWPGSHDQDALVGRMDRALHDAVPGVIFGFSQPIEMRMNELISGVRSDLAVKLYGDDLAVLSRLGDQISAIIARVRGAADLKLDRVRGLPVLRATIDRGALARRGATADDVLDAVETVGGRTVGVVLEGRRRFLERVRLAPQFRGDLDTIRRLPVRTHNEAFAPLADLARIEIIDEPVVINREAMERRLIVQANVRGRDLGSFAAEAQAQVHRQVRLPPGYHLEWGGQFENLRRATARLYVVVPLALLLIFVLLFLAFREVGPALLIFVNVPFATTGGVIMLVLRDLPFSISAGVGMVALFGVAVVNGLVLVGQIRTLRAEGMEPIEASFQGAMRRMRPVLTTALVAALGFIPMAVATGAGAEVQRPLASVVIGGLVTSTLLTLIVLPTLMAWLIKPERKPEGEVAVHG